MTIEKIGMPAVETGAAVEKKPETEKQERECFNFEQAIVLVNETLNLKAKYDSESAEFKMGRKALKDKKRALSASVEKYAENDKEKDAIKKAVQDIFDLETQKQDLEQKMKKELADIKNGKKIEWPGERLVKMNKDSGELEVDGKMVSRIDLLNGISWDNFVELGENVPYEFKEEYLMAVYQKEMDNLKDRQLILNRVVIVDKLHEYKKTAYDESMKTLVEGESKRSGFLFEKMAINLLNEVSAGLPQFGIEVIRYDVTQDVENKIDFVIRIKKKNRAVEVQESSEEKDKSIGIQCTLNTDPENLKKKNSQVKEVNTKIKHPEIKRDVSLDIDELMLVTVPIGGEVSDKYKEWKKNKPVGGPEKLFSADKKIWLVEQMLKGKEIMKDEEFKKKLSEYFKH